MKLRRLDQWNMLNYGMKVMVHERIMAAYYRHNDSRVCWYTWRAMMDHTIVEYRREIT